MDHETISIYIQQKYPFFWKPGASRILLQLKTCFTGKGVSDLEMFMDYFALPERILSIYL